jgi:hypothetical protein
VLLETFVGPAPAGYTADHINRVKADNSITNLRWATRAEQQANRGEHASHAKRSNARVVVATDVKTGVQYTFSGARSANLVFPGASNCLAGNANRSTSKLDSSVRCTFSYATDQLYAFDDDNDDEEWCTVHVKPEYEVSSFGRVRRAKDYVLIHDANEPTRRYHKNVVGYYEMSIVGGFHQLHRIVATAFHGPPPSIDHICHHRDGTRDNNDASNLQWLTPAEHAKSHAEMNLSSNSFPHIYSTSAA